MPDMGDIGGGLDHQGSGHRCPHASLLLLVALIHYLVGVLEASSEQGKPGLWRSLRVAEETRNILNQGRDGELTRELPGVLSSYPICHQEEGKWCCGDRGRSSRQRTLPDEEGIFVWLVLASDAWIQVRADVQRDGKLPFFAAGRGLL
jgi:hypothetical protein